MNEIRDGLLAVECDYTKALFEITFACRLDCGKPTHIYKKRDFSVYDSMETRILLVLCNRLLFTTSCTPST
jgi:hypothetical protein